METKTIQEILKLATDYLAARGVSHARRQAEEVLSLSLGMKRLELYTQFDRPLIEKELEICRHYLQRRGKGEPVAYIHGEVEFLDCALSLTPHVLIPRQETEILAAQIIQALKAWQDPPKKVFADICCGSGCLGIAIKKACPDWEVILSDLSAEALAVAKKNSERNKVEVELRSGDLLTPFKEESIGAAVINPPYISTEEFTLLDREVRDYEPAMALVAGATGLEFYQRLATGLAPLLPSKGRVWMEMGKGQGDPLKKLFDTAPWRSPSVTQDWAGHDRFFFLERE